MSNAGLAGAAQQNASYGSAVVESTARSGGINHSKSVPNNQTADEQTFHEKVTLAWNDIRVTVPARKALITRRRIPSLEILKGVSGIVRPGDMLAIMGASGSGKTTLLNVLTNRSTDELICSGDVLVNGLNLGQKIRSISAYVQQEDLFIGILTVREHLYFQASLRMNQSLTSAEIQSRIDEVMRELGLTKCQNSLIGTPGLVKSISGGERKRLSFASELLGNPQLMFCDEPTSGLDSYMAEQVVSTLKILAQAGRTVVTTIHQPSSETFALFDKILLMAEGRVVYLGTTVGAQQFLAGLGYHCPPLHNPADFFVRTLAVQPGKESESREGLQVMARSFASSADGQKMSQDIAGELGRSKSSGSQSYLDSLDLDSQQFRASYLRQMRMVWWRCWVTIWRDANVLRIRIFQNIFVALIVGLIYLQQPNNQKGVQNINGALFMICSNISFSNIFTVVMTFTTEMALFKRDHDNGSYRTSVYYIGKSLADLPIFIIGPTLYTIVMYWMIGLVPKADRFFILLGTVIFTTNVVVSFGSMASTLAGTPEVGMALAGPIVVPFVLFGGYLINGDSLPDYFIWLEYISWFKYANEIFFVNQWHDFGPIDCEFQPKNGTIIPGQNGTVPTSRCFKDGQEVLESLSYSIDNYPVDFAALAALFVGFRLIGYFFLYLRANPVKKMLFGSKQIKENKQKLR